MDVVGVFYKEAWGACLFFASWKKMLFVMNRPLLDTKFPGTIEWLFSKTVRNVLIVYKLTVM